MWLKEKHKNSYCYCGKCFKFLCLEHIGVICTKCCYSENYYSVVCLLSNKIKGCSWKPWFNKFPLPSLSTKRKIKFLWFRSTRRTRLLNPNYFYFFTLFKEKTFVTIKIIIIPYFLNCILFFHYVEFSLLYKMCHNFVLLCILISFLSFMALWHTWFQYCESTLSVVHQKNDNNFGKLCKGNTRTTEYTTLNQNFPKLQTQYKRNNKEWLIKFKIKP